MKYVQLERGNDWGSEYFSRPGKILTEKGMASIYECGLTFQEGARIRVRWPDGKESLEYVALKEHQAEVFDMGQTYTTRYFLPGIRVEVHGLTQWIPLDKVLVAEEDLPQGKPR